jgi:hypothetical protein
MSMPKMMGTFVGTNAHILMTQGTGFYVSGWMDEATTVCIFLTFSISISERYTYFPASFASFSTAKYFFNSPYILYI